MRKMRPIEYALVVLSAVIAVVCVSLGFWQLGRLADRRAYNAAVFARLNEAPVTVDRLPRDSVSQHYRRALVTGVYDYAHQIVLTNRSRDGSPGINLIAPVRIAGNDTAVLINRGWIYAPDAMTADVAPWREADTINAVGYVVPLSSRGNGAAKSPRLPATYRWLDTAVARTAFPYPVRPFMVVLQGDTKVRGGELPRVAAPPLDEGPHLSYAIQWFAFATIATVGAVFFVRRS
jgi:surfeit locus 1 family protein